MFSSNPGKQGFLERFKFKKDAGQWDFLTAAIDMCYHELLVLGPELEKNEAKVEEIRKQFEASIQEEAYRVLNNGGFGNMTRYKT